MAVTIELYLVRHAIAADRGPNYPDDRVRPLTSEGASRFKACVAALKALNVEIDLVLTSPLLRAVQTADILASGLTTKPKVEQVEALSPGGRVPQVVEALTRAAKRHRHIAVVGHHPELGELAAKLLQARGELEFKKGAVCCIELDGAMPAGPGILKWLLPPRALRKIVR